MEQNRVLTAIDVFSGCGGVTTGLKSAGFHILAYIENNEAAASAYSLNHPTDHHFGDIRELKADTILETLELKQGKLDLLAGCSPCQGFSRMRTRNRKQAVKDARNDLVLEFVRLVEGLLPKTVLFENVAGLVHDSRFEQMVTRLKQAGYHSVNYEILNLMNYGIPQRRRRLILVASRLGEISLEKSLKVVNPRPTVREIIGHLPTPEESDDPIHKSVSVHSSEVMERIKKIPKDGGSRMDLGPNEQLPCHTDFGGYRDVYGRMAWDKSSPTITRFSHNPSKGRYLHPEQDRAISLREASLFQTFPSDYVFPLEEFGRLAVSSMIGEALPPKFAAQLGAIIKNHLLETAQIAPNEVENDDS